MEISTWWFSLPEHAITLARPDFFGGMTSSFFAVEVLNYSFLIIANQN